MKRDERLVGFFDLQIRSVSTEFDAPNTISTKKAFELLERIPVEQRVKAYSRGNEIFYIKDWAWDGDNVHLLINRCDRRLADPTFSNPQELQWRTANREEDEGLDFSCHMVVRTNRNPMNTALAIIETATGLSVVVIQRVLNALMREVKILAANEFEFPHPDGAINDDGTPHTYKCNFTFAFDGHPSDELEQDLEHGHLGGIELIDERAVEQHLDQHGYVREVNKRLQVKLADHVPGGRVRALKNFLQMRSNNFAAARIRFKTDGGIGRTVTVRTDDFMVGAETIFVKREKLTDFQTLLQQSYTEFNPEMVAKMQALLN